MALYKEKFYLFANWKMYLDFVESNILANALANEAAKFPANVKLAVFPSALSFYPVSQVLRDAGISVGPQNFFHIDKGGYTGEMSARMYKALGADYALAGHSERRHIFHETNEEARQKVAAAASVGLTPVVCVGETLDEKKKNHTLDVVKSQLYSALDGLEWPEGKELVVAYEPVWAIGTGEACDPEAAEETHKAIAGWAGDVLPKAELVLLYGGSVKGANISEFLKKPHINGCLVGGASAKLESWMEIVNAAADLA